MSEQPAWSKEEFEAQLRAKDKFYHIHHPYHVLMAEGKLDQKQIQAGWPTASITRSRFR